MRAAPIGEREETGEHVTPRRKFERRPGVRGAIRRSLRPAHKLYPSTGNAVGTHEPIEGRERHPFGEREDHQVMLRRPLVNEVEGRRAGGDGVGRAECVIEGLHFHHSWSVGRCRCLGAADEARNRKAEPSA